MSLAFIVFLFSAFVSVDKLKLSESDVSKLLNAVIERKTFHRFVSQNRAHTE